MQNQYYFNVWFYKVRLISRTSLNLCSGISSQIINLNCNLTGVCTSRNTHFDQQTVWSIGKQINCWYVWMSNKKGENYEMNVSECINWVDYRGLFNSATTFRRDKIFVYQSVVKVYAIRLVFNFTRFGWRIDRLKKKSSCKKHPRYAMFSPKE